MPSPRRISIVDDEAEIRDELAEYFTGKGYEVSVAADGLEGLAIFRSERPDAVVTDLRMPRCSGTQMILHLREIDQAVPIIVITGHYSKTSLDKICQAGATDAFKKPICLRDLNETLTCWLEMHEGVAGRPGFPDCRRDDGG